MHLKMFYFSKLVLIKSLIGIDPFWSKCSRRLLLLYNWRFQDLFLTWVFEKLQDQAPKTRYWFQTRSHQGDWQRSIDANPLPTKEISKAMSRNEGNTQSKFWNWTQWRNLICSNQKEIQIIESILWGLYLDFRTKI